MTTPTSIKSVQPRQWLVAIALISGAVGLLSPHVVQAQGVNMLANDALKALLGKDMPMDSAAANATGAQVMMQDMASTANGVARMVADGSRQRYTVNKGETLDRVIARTMTGVRADIKLIRKAFVALNAQAFPRGTPHIMIAGAHLQVPTMGDLQAMAGGQSLSAQTAGMASASGEPVDKSGWVRFP
jgi:Tfp pilus assembly protein FimV